MIRIAIIFFLNFSIFSVAEAKDVDCSCPEVSCGPCQKKISIGKEVRFCSWGEINVCRKVICENVNYYFGCISSLSKGKKEREGRASLSDTEKDKDFVLPYEDKKKWSKNKNKKRFKKKISKKNSNKKVQVKELPQHATRLPEKGEKPARGVSSLRLSQPEKIKQITQEDILKRSQDEEAVNLNPDGRVAADNESRIIASEKYSEVIVGKVTSVHGSLRWVHHGEAKPLKKETNLYIGNEILNPEDKDKKLSLLFPKGEVNLIIGSKSRLILRDPHSLVGRFQPFIHLVYGSLEANVKMDEGSFDILSGKVISRLVKGKLKTHYEMVEEELRVNVESLKGKILVIKASDLSGKGIEVTEGNFISWVSESAFLSPVFAMSELKRKELGLVQPPKPSIVLKDWAKDGQRAPASSEGESEKEWLCRSPQGQFQQCAWSCEGNPKGAKDCQAQKSSTHCVRRTCNAAGQWGQATPFASAYGDLCPSEGTRVGDCLP